ncbi:hypothetical protein S40293_06375 [Stachybotrys chartarum IBT 40293]|nr:hypothetical protein S40293_06375 [Stachybotrys chartarum IBT 40293]
MRSLINFLALPAAALANLPGRPLTFRDDGTFRIAIFEDLHYGEYPDTYGPLQDALTTKVVTDVLDQEAETDFVVLNGDLISRGNLFAHNSTEYLDQLVAPIIERNLTWGSTYGNHESNFVRHTDAILQREQSWPNGRTRTMVPNTNLTDYGATNYYLPVFGSDCPSGCGCTPEIILWFFDSRFGHEHDERDDEGGFIFRPNWVHERVVEWFQVENERITTKFGKTIPAITFVHMPFKAYMTIQSENGIDPRRNPGMNQDYYTGQADGWCADGTPGCAYGGQDIPFMRAVSSTPGMIGVFVGHHHGNSWCTKWTSDTLPEYVVQPEGEGLFLCFGQRTGYGGGGNWQRGSRQVLLETDKIARGEVETWIRLENGEVVGAVSLNATYGEDLYPESPTRETYCEACLNWGN